MSDESRDAELRKVLADLPKRQRHLNKAELFLLGEYKPTQGSATAIAETIRDAAMEMDIRNMPLDGVNKERQASKQARQVRERELYEQIGDVPDLAATIHALLEMEGINVHLDSVRRDLRELDLT
jgi:hypothetical protein